MRLGCWDELVGAGRAGICFLQIPVTSIAYQGFHSPAPHSQAACFKASKLQKPAENSKLTVYFSSHSRPEQKDGQQRPVNRTYYYIEFRSVIDGIKYRVYQLAALVRKSVNNGADTKGYVCPHCNKRFALLDAVSLEQDDEGLFLCDRCQNPLVDDEESAETKLGHEKIQRMNRQIEKIERFLKEVDGVVIPFNDFDTAIANSVPVPRDKNQLPTATFVPVTAKKGEAAKVQQSIEISITSSEEKTTEELRAEQEKKKLQAEKNALPVWHTQSTVQPGAVTNAGIKEAAERAARERDGVGLARRELEVEEKAKGEEGGQGDGRFSEMIMVERIWANWDDSYCAVLRSPCGRKGEGRSGGSRFLKRRRRRGRRGR